MGRGPRRARGKDMGNTMRQGHRLHFSTFGRMLVGVGRRPETTSIRCAQLPQWHASQIHDVLAHPCRFQSDFHTDEGFSDKAKSPLPSNLPIAADAAYLPTLGITQLQRVGPPIRSAFAVTFRRRSLAQRFVRTNSIVAIDPAIGSPLLSLASCWRQEPPGRL